VSATNPAADRSSIPLRGAPRRQRVAACLVTCAGTASIALSFLRVPTRLMSPESELVELATDGSLIPWGTRSDHTSPEARSRAYWVIVPNGKEVEYEHRVAGIAWPRYRWLWQLGHRFPGYAPAPRPVGNRMGVPYAAPQPAFYELDISWLAAQVAAILVIAVMALVFVRRRRHLLRRAVVESG
jgi:hypothetical protein